MVQRVCSQLGVMGLHTHVVIICCWLLIVKTTRPLYARAIITTNVPVIEGGIIIVAFTSVKFAFQSK